jgi:energy-coupling factor transporter ATP-binding protein EcfA2
VAKAAAKSSREWLRGSTWHRWDPHLHCPGTLKADEYKGHWDGYFAAIESAKPRPSALGITDYFSLNGYKEFRDRRPPGSFPWVTLVFPNVEMRLTTPTRRGGPINVHLLFSPHDPDHIRKIETHLARLDWEYDGRSFPCSDAGLIDLGRAYTKDESLPPDVALREGAGQFHVEISGVVGLFKDAWVRDNALIAVTAGEDGLGGIKDSSFGAFREELGQQSHIIFSGNPTDREFWSSNKPKAKRPCLHGSDAHSVPAVLQPAENRRCWIRGDATFESLRQTVAEPERRVFIGSEPPRDTADGYVIEKLRLGNAPWIENDELTFNDGLVTVIGAKGSGKTALADLIALAAGADEDDPGTASFIRKARSRIVGLKADLSWADSTLQGAVVQARPQPSAEPRVQYLSQQFVERLSGPQEIGELLVEEIERVVFNAIPDEDRLEASSFVGLRDIVLEDCLNDRSYHQLNVQTLTAVVSEELALRNSIPVFEAKVVATNRDVDALKAETKAIPAPASKAMTDRHALVSAALQELRSAIAKKRRRAQELGDVKGEVMRQMDAITQTSARIRQDHPELLDNSTWETLVPRIAPGAVEGLATLQAEARADAERLRTEGLPKTAKTDPTTAGGLEALEAKLAELEAKLGLDKTRANKKAELERRLTTAKSTAESAAKELVHARGAEARQKDAIDKRLDSYEAVFATLVEEERQLRRLYQPLVGNLRGTKLSFEVVRVVDLDAWIARGEEILDMRHLPFSDRSYLPAQAQMYILRAWEGGNPENVRAGMRKFIAQVGTQAIEALTQNASPVDLGNWLFSTDHIRIRYGVRYEGVELSQLSPGTRGLVLLTLYLKLDQWDLRPLIIDQPEENLDPSSVHTELVDFFRTAAKRRQIIMVTHNANLVVNTDSDQVIVASSTRKSAKALPHVTYHSGGLEDPAIREDVCRLLEGGRDAFERRGLRYGVRFA